MSLGNRHSHMARIAITDGMAPNAIKHLEDSGHEVVVGFIAKNDLLAGALADFDAVIIRSATKMNAAIISANSNLKVIGRAGVGVDNIDLLAAKEHGVVVVNAPRASTQSVIELTIGHLLTSIRHITSSNRGLRSGLWEKKKMTGTELSGKCLGLIGYGRIAQGVAAVAKAMGMEIHAYDPYLPKRIAKQQGARLHDKIEHLFENCTHISIHCNLNDDTYHLVNAEMMAKMPKKSPDGIECGNHIVNCARGGIIDEDDLLVALDSGVIASAALDVFEVEPVPKDHALLQHENFHGTPHIGAATLEAQARVGIDIGDAVMVALSGEEPETIVRV